MTEKPLEYEARRGDDVENWLKTPRNSHEPNSSSWFALDDVLEDYRLHSDTGTPLSREAEEGYAR